MGRLLRENWGKGGTFATIRLESGDTVMLSMSPVDVKILKMKFGHFPVGTLWRRTVREDADRHALLDWLRDQVLKCSSLEEIPTKLDRISKSRPT
jgi:hypothetical protein